jgi:hypothetical protein
MTLRPLEQYTDSNQEIVLQWMEQFVHHATSDNTPANGTVLKY